MKRPLVSQLDPDYQALGQEGKLARIDSFNGARALSHALSSIGLSLEQLRVAQDLLARPLKQNELRIKHGNETCHESNARKLCLIFFCFWFSLVIMLGFPMIFFVWHSDYDAKGWFIYNVQTKGFQREVPVNMQLNKIPALISVSDQGAVNRSCLHFLAYSQHQCMISAQWDSSHRCWNVLWFLLFYILHSYDFLGVGVARARL